MEKRMATADKEIMIKAPLEKVFNFVLKPSNLLQIWPSLIDIKNERLLPNGGYSAKWMYKMGGMHFHGASEVTDIHPNCWFTSKIHGALDCTITWTFRSKENQIRVTLTAEYRVPLPLISRVTEILITKMNDKEADLILDNLRAKFEEN
jgi:ligand-binding SRPBCC domain-containing protein